MQFLAKLTQTKNKVFYTILVKSKLVSTSKPSRH